MKFTKIFSALTLTAAVLSVAGCEEGGTTTASKTGGSGGHLVQPLPDNTVIMKYNGGTITAKELNEQLKPQFAHMDEEVRDAYKHGAERALLTHILGDEAKKAGVASPEALLQKVVGEASVSDDQVKAFFKANKLDAGVPDPKTGKKRKVSMEEVKNYLLEQERQSKQQSYLQGLMAQANAQTVLEEPRVTVKSNGNEPFEGGANAKVVVQEFSDFQCPFCSKGRVVLQQIHEHYGDKVKLVFRNFPLDFHPQAMPAAIAAACANRQGKFWEMHNKFFDNQKELTPEGINKTAKEIGLDMAKFESCVKNSETSGDIKKDMDVASEVGVNSTPTFFVNGKKLAGALPFEQFKSLIDAELGKM